MGRKIGSFGLVNYKRHPENENIIVFNFNSPEEAALFESELVKDKVWFEKETEEVKNYDKTDTLYLFAVRSSALDKALGANVLVHSRFKNPIFKNKGLKYAFLLLFAALLAIAIVGYVKNPQNVQPADHSTEKDSL